MRSQHHASTIFAIDTIISKNAYAELTRNGSFYDTFAIYLSCLHLPSCVFALDNDRGYGMQKDDGVP